MCFYFCINKLIRSDVFKCCVSCPYGWIAYKEKCFYISDLKKDWLNSKQFCREKNSSLFIIQSEYLVQFSISFFSDFNLNDDFYYVNYHLF